MFEIGDFVRMWTAPDNPKYYGIILRPAGVGAFAVYWLFSEQVSEYCSDYILVKIGVL